MKALVEHRGHWPENRIVQLEGGRNFRDLGGYPTSDGRRIRWGLLFRAGSPVNLTEHDWSQLCARGLQAVCDLRTHRERSREPFSRVHETGVSYWAGEFDASFAELRETMNAGFLSGEDAHAGMIAGYRELPFEQAAAYRQLFKHLKAGEVPLIFNCTAGKDRTGMAAALVLSTLGVEKDLIIEDYALTNEVLNAERVAVSKTNGRLSRQPREVIDAIGRADPAYISAALEAIERKHDNILGFVNDVLNVSEDDVAAIQSSLLE